MGENMLFLLLSINPEHVKSIFDGKKMYEYRKFRCKKNVDKIMIYSTFPVKKVVGEADIADILEGYPDDIWNQTKEQSGITYDFFSRYYQGKKKAVAYRIENLVIYDKPLTLNDIGVSHAPQSYRYVQLKGNKGK